MADFNRPLIRTYWASWSRILRQDIAEQRPILGKSGNLRLLSVHWAPDQRVTGVPRGHQSRFQIHFEDFDELQQGNSLEIVELTYLLFKGSKFDPFGQDALEVLWKLGK